MKVIMVHWYDAVSDNSWLKIDDVHPSTGLTQSVGFLVKETKEAIVLSHTYDPDSSHVNGTMEIPKALIKKRRTLWTKKKKSP